MKGLTKKQREIVDYVQAFIANHRYSPSYREIGEHFGFSSLGSVYNHINALKRKGVLLSESNTSRSLMPVMASEVPLTNETYEIPLIGTLAVDKPIQTFTHCQQITVPRVLVHNPEKTYAVRVEDDSFNEEMIVKGDILLVEARQQAHNGEIVVALINGRDTIVKRYQQDGSDVQLVGCHMHHHPMILRSKDILIQGILVSIIRIFT